ncbi:MAG: phosphoenolpyruvate carboxykinase, partial [Candidatus Gastranaerophilales bacterium]|nr:phosphoenolpyruvate carboxykinase [Candidatus Gastranaerophilales bacterium]
FRVYPLSVDYTRFKQLIEDGVDCYILNTGEFMGTKVQPKHTLGIIEAIVSGEANFHKWENFSDIEIMDIEGFDASFANQEYAKEFAARMQDRINFVKSRETEKAGIDKLPADALEALENVVKQTSCVNC